MSQYTTPHWDAITSDSRLWPQWKLSQEDPYLLSTKLLKSLLTCYGPKSQAYLKYKTQYNFKVFIFFKSPTCETGDRVQEFIVFTALAEDPVSFQHLHSGSPWLQFQGIRCLLLASIDSFMHVLHIPTCRNTPIYMISLLQYTKSTKARRYELL